MTAAVDWCAEVPQWTRFLREQGFHVSVADDLRLAVLIDRLKAQSIPIPDVEAAAHWFGPVLCRNADDQRRLPNLIADWASRFAGETPRSLPLRPATAQVAREIKREHKGSTGLWAAVLLVVLAALYTTVSVQLNDHGGPERQAATSPSGTNQHTPEPASSTAPRWRAAILVFVPFALVLIMRRRTRKQAAALMRGLVPRDAPAEAVRVAVGEYGLFRPEALRGAMADLRRHRMVRAEWIDAARTVSATIAAAGQVQLVQALRPAVPSHLVLVDLAGAGDILGALAQMITERLQAEDVRFERFDYQGDPRNLRCIDGRGAITGTVDLDTLFAMHPEHRLLIISDAASFSEAGGDRLRSWVELLARWPEVALLTPLPPNQWGPRERALMRLGFNVSQATPNGVKDLARQLRKDLPLARGSSGAALPPRFDRRFAAAPYQWLGESAPSSGEVVALSGDLRDVLGPRAYLYLCALAVFPITHPKLTLAVGKRLADDSGQPLLDEDTLARLCRVPWLRRGRLPDWLRLALVRDLRAEPQRSDRVHAVWLHLLEPLPPSASGESLPIEVVTGVDPALPQIVAAAIEQGKKYREAILLAFLNRDELPELAVELPHYAPQQSRLRRVPPVDVVTLAVGVVCAALVGVFLGQLTALADATGALLLTESGAALVRNQLLPAMGVGFGAFALVMWYARDLRYKSLSVRLDPLFASVLAAASFVANLSWALLDGNRDTAPALVLLSAMLVVWAWGTENRRALRWTPLIVALLFDVRIASGLNAPLWMFGFVLVAWLALDHNWSELRLALAFAAPAALLGLPVARDAHLGPGVADFIAWGVVARLLADESFRQRCLQANTFGWRAAGVLALPLGAVLLVRVPALHASLEWDPGDLALIAFFIMGLCQPATAFRRAVPGFIAFGVLLVGTHVAGWPFEWRMSDAAHAISQWIWVDSALSAGVCFMCGAWVAGTVRRPGGFSPSARFALLVVLLTALGSIVRVSLPVILHTASFSGPVVSEHCLSIVSGMFALLFPRYGRNLAIVLLVATLAFLGAAVLQIHAPSLTLLAETFTSMDWSFSASELLSAVLTIAIVVHARERILSGLKRSLPAADRFTGFSEAPPLQQPRLLVPLLDWGRWTWPVCAGVLALIVGSQTLETVRANAQVREQASRQGPGTTREGADRAGGEGAVGPRPSNRSPATSNGRPATSNGRPTANEPPAANAPSSAGRSSSAGVVPPANEPSSAGQNLSTGEAPSANEPASEGQNLSAGEAPSANEPSSANQSPAANGTPAVNPPSGTTKRATAPIRPRGTSSRNAADQSPAQSAPPSPSSQSRPKE